MTAYTTPEAVRGVLTRDSDDPDGTAATLDDPVIQAQIDAAQAEIDARLAGRYQTPFTDTVPPLVASLTVDIAQYLANLVYRQSEDLAAEDPSVLRYQRAVQLLKDLGSGAADLPGEGGGGDVTPSGRATVRNPYEGNLFGLDTWGLGYRRRADRGW